MSFVKLEELVATYTASASAHGKATESGDNTAANTAYDQLTDAYRQIRSRGAESLRYLLPLLSSDDYGVRLWAASHALEIQPDAAEPVLADLASKPQSLVAFSAEMTLKQWRKGTLKFS